MRGLKSAILCLATGAIAITASAPAVAGDIYGAAMGSYVVLDSKRPTENGFGLSVLGGMPLTDYLSGEANLFMHQVNLDAGNGKQKSYGGGLDAVLGRSPIGGSFAPFVLIGLGVEQDKLVKRDDKEPFADVGIGLRSDSLRAELRAYGLTKVDSLSSGSTAMDLRLNVGLVFGGHAAAPEPVARPAPVPMEPVAPVEPVAPPPPPAPVAVVEKDKDHDGVADADDKCPGTAPGAVVDANGCVEIEKVVLKGVNFGPGSSKLLPAASGTLRSVALAMKANTKLAVEVDGYTDSSGIAAKNLKLSEARAKSVKAFLVKEGVAADRLTTKGFGAADPVDTNATPAGRANNRRVAFKVLD